MPSSLRILWTDVLPMRQPIFLSSPTIRSYPQSTFSIAILRTILLTHSGMRGLPDLLNGILFFICLIHLRYVAGLTTSITPSIL